MLANCKSAAKDYTQADENIGADNYRDYIQFMTEANAAPIKLSNKEAIAQEVELKGKKLACLHEYFEL